MEDSNIMEGKFTEEEVLVAIFGLNGEKASGSDDFPIVLWSFIWEFVKEEVMSFFKDFYEPECHIFGDDSQKGKCRRPQRL